MLLLGIGCGYAVLNMFARWHPVLEENLVVMLVGAIVGLVFGLALDAKFKDSQSRKKLISWLWTILITGAILFYFFHPAFQTARE